MAGVARNFAAGHDGAGRPYLFGWTACDNTAQWQKGSSRKATPSRGSGWGRLPKAARKGGSRWEPTESISRATYLSSRKQVLTLLVALLVGLGTARAVSFKEANGMLSGGDAGGAASAYEALLAQGMKGSAIYANLGRALQQRGKTAAAALNYHRALMLNPQRAEARQGLLELRAAAGLPEFAPNWRQKLTEKVSPSFLLVFGDVLFWSSLFLLVAVVFRSKRKVKRRRLPALLGGICLLFIGAAMLGIGWWSDPRVAHAHLAVITADQGALALSQPVETAARVASLPAGSPITVLSERGDWDYCQLPNGGHAWLPSSNLSFVNPEHVPDRS